MPDAIIWRLFWSRADQVHDAATENHARLRAASLESGSDWQHHLCADVLRRFRSDGQSRGDGFAIRATAIGLGGNVRIGSHEVLPSLARRKASDSRSQASLFLDYDGSRRSVAAGLGAFSLQCARRNDFAPHHLARDYLRIEIGN